MRSLLMAVIGCVCLATPCVAAEEFLINLPKAAQAPGLGPGSTILLPDGRTTVITDLGISGDWRTELGIVISPDGVIREGELAGKSVQIREPEAVAPATTNETPMGSTKPGSPATAKKEELSPLNTRPESTSSISLPSGQSPAKSAPATAPDKAEEQALSLAQLIPLTTIRQEAAAKPEAAQKNKEQPVTQAKSAPAAKPAQPARTEPKKSARPAVGEELRIPPEALKTGNLDFLEGCWQGTRPEYFSKRTIKECFCFDSNGRNGKRRIYDTQYGRQCIGASQASLSSSGVLSVSSEGGVCTDGERWGSAEMVCRNSGARTPCSWVFHDANNGRQAYVIPFVRVESCGR